MSFGGPKVAQNFCFPWPMISSSLIPNPERNIAQCMVGKLGQAQEVAKEIEDLPRGLRDESRTSDEKAETQCLRGGRFGMAVSENT